MSALFRSKKMTRVQISMHQESTQDTMRALGAFGKFHFVDLNRDDAPSGDDFIYWKRRVVSCVTWERQLERFEEEMRAHDINVPYSIKAVPYECSDVLAEIQAYLEPLEVELNRNISYKNADTRALNSLLERGLVLNRLRTALFLRPDPNQPGAPAGAAGSSMFGRSRASSSEIELELSNLSENQMNTPLLQSDHHGTTAAEEEGERRRRRERGFEAARANAEDPESGATHNFITGILPVVQMGLFTRMLFRLSRGNALAHFCDPDEVDDPESGETMEKAVFYIAYVRGLRARIEKLCEHLRATLYEVPASVDEIESELLSLEDQVVAKRNVLRMTRNGVVDTLKSVAVSDSHPSSHVSGFGSHAGPAGHVMADDEDGDGVERAEMGMAAGGNFAVDRPLVFTDGCSPLRNWQETLRREKAICDRLKRCHFPENSSMVIAEGWCPTDAVEELQATVRQAVQFSGAQPALVQKLHRRGRAPPTYFPLTEVTGTFQGIVDTYGVPRYREVNPGLFTIVTFPFLFGIMYGDIGHGTCLFLAASWLIWNQAKLEKMRVARTLGELPTMAYQGRYLLWGMGLCAIYCGTIYNDCFSVPIDVFGTQYYWPPDNGPVAKNETVNAIWRGDTYVYGVDPGWYHTNNELTFFNSLKMKISVTFGVSQMTFGILLGLLNHLHFKDNISIWFEFVPQLLFMLSTFGYMIFLIIFKFTIDWETSSINPPNLIQTMIKMFLSPGSVAADEQLYSGQGGLQLFLIAIAGISIPWMLLPKPLIHNHLHKKKRAAAEERARAQGYGGGARLGREGPSIHNSPYIEDDDDDEGKFDDEEPLNSGHEDSGYASDDDDTVDPHAGEDGHGEFDLSEHMIHQAIHTIEFVLGCVSNTASYLRLWALSLAHAELSAVFWDKLIMEYGVNSGSFFMTFVGWGAWAGATFAVLLCMDVLECFLHALRLHWVEFQNKFFNADGYAFEPFTFEHKDE